MVLQQIFFAKYINSRWNGLARRGKIPPSALITGMLPSMRPTDPALGPDEKNSTQPFELTLMACLMHKKKSAMSTIIPAIAMQLSQRYPFTAKNLEKIDIATNLLAIAVQNEVILSVDG